uniref:Potassium channel, subfamily K, member 18 n=1 Tax=Sphaeramia orbicularis TaxID=375764 RepID=A0A673BDV4_9TELE
MSVAVRGKIAAKSESRKCAARACRLIPHLLLCLSLVAYAALGGFVFELIEGPGGGSDPSIQPKYQSFLQDLVQTVQNLSGKSPDSSDRSSIQLQDRDRDRDQEHQSQFKASVGGFNPVQSSYGEIYPVTLTGKVVCVLYAMVGIPLMLLVILDVGDFMALLMSRTYVRLHSLCKAIRSRARSPWKPRTCADSLPRPLEDEYLFFQSRRCRPGVRQKSIQLQNNKEIFEKILARENLLRKSPLLRSLSCPELDRDGMETLDVPFVLILFIVFAYILLGGLILPIWETEFKGFDPYYFCFITLTTIGLVKSYPVTPNTFMLTSLFIIIGMAIMSMAFKLSQSRIVSFYRQCIKFK